MMFGTRFIPGLPLTAGLVCLVAQPCAAATDTRGAQIAAACASCHRVDGRDSGIPPVVGLDEVRIVKSLWAYRSGERAGPIMHVVAAALSPEEIAAVAHYLAGQRPAPVQR
jgi:cytochrome subunit of sulfide dehydrogenase